MRRYQVAVVSHGSPSERKLKRSGNSLCEDWDTVQKPQLERGVESRGENPHAQPSSPPALNQKLREYILASATGIWTASLCPNCTVKEDETTEASSGTSILAEVSCCLLIAFDNTQSDIV